MVKNASYITFIITQKFNSFVLIERLLLIALFVMAVRMSMKRKASLKLRVAEMNTAKLKRQSYDSSEGSNTDSLSENPTSSMDETLQLPAPLESMSEG